MQVRLTHPGGLCSSLETRITLADGSLFPLGVTRAVVCVDWQQGTMPTIALECEAPAMEITTEAVVSVDLHGTRYFLLNQEEYEHYQRALGPKT